MTTYSAISDVETTAGQPAFASVARRQRDNLKALAEGDASVPVAERLTPGSFKPPTAASQTQVIGRQGDANTSGGAIAPTAFRGTVVVPGVYTFAGTRSTTSGNDVFIFVNDVLAHTASVAGFTHEMTLAAGDRILVGISTASGVTFSDFRLLSEFVVPMAQCQFFQF